MNGDRDALVTAVSEIVRRSATANAATVPEIRPEMSLLDDLNLDSLTLVDVILDLEDRFKIKVADTEIKEVFTVNDLTDLVLRKQQPAEVA